MLSGLNLQSESNLLVGKNYFFSNFLIHIGGIQFLLCLKRNLTTVERLTTKTETKQLASHDKKKFWVNFLPDVINAVHTIVNELCTQLLTVTSKYTVHALSMMDYIERHWIIQRHRRCQEGYQPIGLLCFRMCNAQDLNCI